MLKTRLALIVPAAVLCAGLIAPRALAQPAPTWTGQTTTKTVIVETVDQKTRQVLLSGPQGELATVIAGPEVRNLRQLKAGDRLVITQRKAVAVKLLPSDQPLSPPSVRSAGVRAARGQLPAGGSLELVTSTVAVTSVDEDTHTVNFTRADGSAGQAVVNDPNLQKFAEGLKPGDHVQISFLQSISIVTQPMGQTMSQ
jgi:hypothetical protein